MHNIIIERPYAFVPPHQGRFWPWCLQKLTRRRLSRVFGIEQVDCRGLERLQQSIASGHGVLLAPNHCRPSDPFAISEALRQAGTTPFIMASWHLFATSRFQSWLLQHAGVFSVYREGLDRQAVSAAIDILESARRPLVIFPEGVISRTNDRLNPLMEGTAFIARSAAKKRSKAAPPGQVVVHPVAMKYFHRGDTPAAIQPVLDEIEQRLSWRPNQEMPVVERITNVGLALLALKEIEYLGSAQTGTIAERLKRLIDHLLVPLEKEWLGGKQEPNVVARVKKLRMAVLPDLIGSEITAEERERRWRHLSDMYLAQQLSLYPEDYIKSNPTPERMLETVERFEENLTDVARIHRPMSVTVEIGIGIVASPTRDRSGGEDPLMAQIEEDLNRMIGNIKR